MRLNWAWLMTILDSTEAQLRFGSALSSASETGNDFLKILIDPRILMSKDKTLAKYCQVYYYFTVFIVSHFSNFKTNINNL